MYKIYMKCIQNLYEMYTKSILNVYKIYMKYVQNLYEICTKSI